MGKTAGADGWRGCLLVRESVRMMDKEEMQPKAPGMGKLMPEHTHTSHIHACAHTHTHNATTGAHA